MIKYSPDGKFTAWHFPGANLIYGFDWFKDGYLEDGATVTGQTWEVPDGVVMTRELITEDGHITAAFFEVDEDGEGETFVITNRITMSDTQTDARTITLICKRW